jgi:hypothetical protein
MTATASPLVRFFAWFFLSPVQGWDATKDAANPPPFTRRECRMVFPQLSGNGSGPLNDTGSVALSSNLFRKEWRMDAALASQVRLCSYSPRRISKRHC